MLVTFSGLDGAGKTTQIELFMEYLYKNNFDFKKLRMYEDISTSSFIRGFFKRRRKVIVSGKEVTKQYRYDKNRKESGIVFIRKLTYISDLLILIVKKLYYQRICKKVIIADRYLYDSLANLFDTNSKTYSNIMLKLIPKPDAAIFLDVEPQVAFSRKPEYHPSFYPERRQAYLDIFSKLKSGFVVHSNGIVSIHDDIIGVFNKVRNAKKKNPDQYSAYVEYIMNNLFKVNCDAEGFSELDFEELIKVLAKNRIRVRFLNKCYQFLEGRLKTDASNMLTERSYKIKRAFEIIAKITQEFDSRGLRMLVIKTTDNYPDLGQDIDIFTDAPVKDVDDILLNKFNAKLEKPTLAEIISTKRNYKIEGFPKLEVHCAKLGEVGEDNLLAKDIISSRVKSEFNGIITYIPEPEYRLILCVLQRIYRHLNIRICDVYNSINLINSNLVDWGKLEHISLKYGIWEGVLLYLSYVRKISLFYGIKLTLPLDLKLYDWPKEIRDKNMHFRFPLFSTGVNVYSRKVFSELRKRNFHGLSSLSLIIPLSLMHFISVKLFGKSRTW